MSADAVVVALVVLGFATLVTAHLAIVVGLVGRHPRWRALAALVVPPLAPYWGARNHMIVRAAAWIGGACLYLFARVLAAR